MAVTIYHNPRCSKSRKTLELIVDSGTDHSIVLYLQDTPDAATMQGLANKLALPLSDILRKGEAVYKEAGNLPEDEAALASWVADNPIVLERPIVVDDDSGRAVIGRPPENVLKLLG